MSVIVAVNIESRLVLLEDGREQPITGFYHSDGPGVLRAEGAVLDDALKMADDASLEDIVALAEIMTVGFPGTDVFLIVEMNAIEYAGKAN